MEPGQFDEPVGIAIDAQNQIYIADTWNQRIQVFSQAEDGSFTPVLNWELVAWFGQSLDNKPYLAVDNHGSVFVTDPEGYRVLEFTDTGDAVRFWGDYGVGLDQFGLAASVAVDPNGYIWVSDAGNGRIMRFEMPPP
jgi:DNA-binding beta-propeller fold protein YncE